MNALILTYDFPPHRSVGALRPRGWLEHLPLFGVRPTVVTRHWPPVVESSEDCVRPSVERELAVEDDGERRVVRAPFDPDARDRMILGFGLGRLVAVRKALSLGLSLLEHATDRIGHYGGIYRAAREEMARRSYDVIIATGGPFVLLTYARWLSEEYGVPWVADYRDGWSTSEEIRHVGLLHRLVRGRLFREIEKRVVATASLITAASPTYAEKLRELHPEKPVEVVLNGFRDEVVADLEPRPSEPDSFEIAYAGTIYEAQPLETFLDGYADFIERSGCRMTRAVFYGAEFYPDQQRRILSHRLDLAGHLRTTPRLDYPELLRRLQDAHILLLLTWKGADWLFAKIFDYLAVDRRIMVVEGDGSVIDGLIAETGAGAVASNRTEVCEALLEAYHAFKETGEVSTGARAIDISRYGRRAQTGRLARALRDHL